jgi:hypothetical protein
MVTRGETRRIAELADLALTKWPDFASLTPCFAVVLQMLNGKTNKYSKAEYIGAMRHKNLILCTMSALARYLFWR